MFINNVVCGYFNSSPRWGAPLYYKKEERFFLFAVILTPHPAGELLFITKKRSVFLDVLNAKSVISAPLSTKRSWRVASEEFDSTLKNTVVCGCF